ncbi:DUF2341 domain-containing protein [Aliirhizobium terrae]|uniref:DUF2341 domain-containing protein n=1 Tax=Terrirhizobium terrae TaxID=2926709 RepID=UPI00336ABB16
MVLRDDPTRAARYVARSRLSASPWRLLPFRYLPMHWHGGTRNGPCASSLPSTRARRERTLPTRSAPRRFSCGCIRAISASRPPSRMAVICVSSPETTRRRWSITSSITILLLGEALVWVSVPDIQPGATMNLWMYYGNEKAPAPQIPRQPMTAARSSSTISPNAARPPSTYPHGRTMPKARGRRPKAPSSARACVSTARRRSPCRHLLRSQSRKTALSPGLPGSGPPTCSAIRQSTAAGKDATRW